jgi:hypothetical protein
MQTRIGAASLVVAVLVAAPQAGLAQGAPFCLKSASGMLSCAYHSMILCEQAKQPNSADQCVPRLQADVTTGSSAAPLGGPRPRGIAPAAMHPSPAR